MAKKRRPSQRSTLDLGQIQPSGEVTRLNQVGRTLFPKTLLVGACGVAATAFLASQEASSDQFFHSYLVAYMWTLSIGLGALWWVVLQHLVGAHWSVVLRRIGELLSANAPVLALLSVPIVLPVLQGNDSLYLWADAHRMHDDHLLHQKAAYLNISFFAVRMVGYFAFWTFISTFFLRSSLKQDHSDHPEKLLSRMRSASAPSMIGFAITLTFAAFDLLMSLDPTWFSTIFGVYYFAGCVVAVHAAFALILIWLQSSGHLTKSVTQEHFHDVGKMLFAFVVFWAYIAFSQFLLIWYANIPEETQWYQNRFTGSWLSVSVLLLVGHFVLPFLGLLSRHIKRNKKTLGFWAVWLLVAHYLDLYWLVMPKLSPQGISPHLLDLSCFLAVSGLFFAGIAYRARKVNLIPKNDPRLKQSLAFENI